MIKTHKWGEAEPSTQSLFQKKGLVLVSQIYTKADIKVSHPVQFSLIPWYFFINFVHYCVSTTGGTKIYYEVLRVVLWDTTR